MTRQQTLCFFVLDKFFYTATRPVNTNMAERFGLNSAELECFACGRENASGLQMRFQSDGNKLYSTLTPPLHFRGWHNLLHGGIVSTILDEIMAWAAIHFLEKFPLTKTIQVEFLRQVYVEQELTATGWLVERIGKREVMMAGRIEDVAGRSLAEGQGAMMLTEPESRLFRRMVPEELGVEMKKIFSSATKR